MAPLAKRLFAKYKHTSSLFWHDYNQSSTKLDHPVRFQRPLPFWGTQFINLEKTGRMGLWPRCLPHKNKLYHRQQQLSRSFTQWLNLVYKDILGSCGSNRQLWPPPYFDWPSPHCTLPTSSASMPQMPKWQQYGVDWENFNKNSQWSDDRPLYRKQSVKTPSLRHSYPKSSCRNSRRENQTATNPAWHLT